jgi:SPP1 family predicted phage head-tail adaptor
MAGAGPLDRRITIERATTVPNEFNEPVETWVPLPGLTDGKIWARREDVSDGEKFAAGQVGSALRSRFVVRSSTVTKTVTPVDRLNYDSAIWNIHGVKETKDGRNRFIEITAVRRTD